MPLTHASAIAGAGARRLPPLVLVIAVQCAVMTALAAILGTWVDEEYTLATTAHGALYATGHALGFEQQAPLYFVLIALLREIAPTVFAARLFSVACALGTTAAAAAIARRLWPSVDPWPFALLVAFNPFVVDAALEIRLYSPAILLSAVLWLTFYDGFFQGARSRARIAFIVLAVAALYLEYFLAFELVGFAVALLVARRWNALIAYAAASAICIAAFAPMLVVIGGQMHAALAVAASKAPPLRAVFLHPLLDFIVPYGFAGAPAAPWVDRALLAGVTLAVMIARPRLDRKTLALGAAVLSVEAIYVVLIDALHEPLYVPRHFVALFVPEVAFAYAVLARFPHRRNAPAALGAIVALVAFATFLSLGYTYRDLAKAGDWPRVAAWLEKHARRGDTIVLYQGDLSLPFERYYHGAARVAPFPHPLDPNVYSVARLAVRSKREALRAFAALPAAGRLWFVEYDTCNAQDYFGCLEVAAALRERFRIVERHEFYETTVERLVWR